MTKKKIALCTIAIIALMAGTLVTPSLVKTDKAAAASETVKTIFSDDFSTYNSYDDMGHNWSNYYFDQTDTIAQYGAGTERVDWADSEWASVIQDPDDSSNKVLDVHTETWGERAGGNSYFYITPSKDGEPLLLKNYTISFRYKVKNTCVGANGVTAPWIGTLNRKKNLDANGDYQPYDGAYIDTTNAFMSARAGTRKQDVSGTSPYYFSEALLWDIGREPMPVGTATNTIETSNIYGDWMTYKCVVLENTFTLYLNDTLMTQFTVPTYDSQAKNLDAGYVSIACCVLDAYLDDVMITTTPDHPEVSGQTEIAREQGVAMPVVYDLETYGEAITQVDVRRKGEKTTALDSDAYTYENGLFRLDANYVSLLPKGKTEFVIHTAKGSVNVVVNVTDANVLPSTPISLTATKGADKSVALTGATAVYGISRGEKAVSSSAAWSFANGTLTLTKDYINYLFSDNDLPLFVYTDAGYYTLQLTIVDAKIISVEKNIAEAGSVTGAGGYQVGETATLTATTNEGYSFLGWYDGETLVWSGRICNVVVAGDKTYTAKWEKATYTITVVNSYPAAGSVTGEGDYKYGETVTLTAISNTGHEFLGWWEGSSQISGYETYSFTVTENRTLEVKWKINLYTITVNKNIDEAGRVIGGGSYMHGGEVDLTAKTNNGYTFLGWYDGETQLSPNASYKFAATADRTITAKWTKTTYTIAVDKNIPEAGSVTGVDTYEHDATVTLTVNTNEGYTFDGFYEGDRKVWGNTTYIFTATENRTLVAKWKKNTCDITVTAGEGGSATGAGTYEQGATVTLTATINTGYTFDGWYVNGTKQSSDETYTFTATANVTVEARFVLNSYTITATSEDEVKGTVTGGGAYSANESVTLTANANTGYTFEGWYDGETKVTSDATYSFTATAARTLVAKFTKNIYVIGVDKNIAEAGSVTGAGSYEYGETVALMATTNAGYRFLGWYDGNTLVSSGETFTFVVAGSKTYTAKWEEIVSPAPVPTYTITIERNIVAAGEVTDSGVFDEGATLTLMATTNEGYRFLGWYDGETLLSANAKYQVTVSADKTYTAKWEEIVAPSVPTYTITINRNMESAGEVTDSGTFDEGETLTLIATTNEGYRFLGWYDGNTLLSANAKYQVTISANKTYTAKWEEIAVPSVSIYMITINRNIAEAGSVTGGGIYYAGEIVTLNATTNAGYRFLGWYDGETRVYSSETFKPVVVGNKTYTAKWEKVTDSNFVGCSSTVGTLPIFITAGALVCGIVARKKRKDEEQ